MVHYHREAGRTVPIDEVQHSSIKRGRLSEHEARRYFEQAGFRVEMTTANGPDLIISRGSKTKSVEVKTVGVDHRRGIRLRVHPVLKTRRNDDLVALVFNGRVLVIEMSEHLSKCPASGFRDVTDLFKASA